MTSFEHIISYIASIVWGWPMVILLLGTHIFLTIRLKFPQLYIFKAIKLSVIKDKNSTGDVSQFGALATSLAATIGTGNIIGVATAVALGGPGAVLWCWMTGIFGVATKYSEGLLAIKYRVKTSRGTMLGGPMYALEKGLKMKWLAVLFCIFTAVAAFGIGNSVQANAIATILSEPGLFGTLSTGIPTYISGLIMALLVALVIIFGIKGIANVCGMLVPFMAIFYVLGCVIILFYNGEYLGEAIRVIFREAFSLKSATGGITGSVLMMAARYGIARGIFSNESGLGSAPIVAAAAQTRNPVRQALISSTATFWDTVVICAITGLVLVSSVIAHPDINYSDGAKLTFNAFGKIPYVGSTILIVGLLTFAFSTILGWSYYAEKALEYLAGNRVIVYYKIAWVVMVFVGATANLSIVWDLSDVTNALMALPNLVSLLLLSGVIAAETRKYLWSGKLDDYE
jgi:alanine or glycine:cation symporter, AGCS family